MQIDHCLILAAGFGTRMGPIGTKLPKVLWPVFERPLLELQVAYARSLGASRISINLHHQGELIESYCRGRATFEGVEFLWEKPEILDIGGAIHNLASRVGYRGRLLVLNADQFFYLDASELIDIHRRHSKSPCVLLSYPVDSRLGYNALDVGPDRCVRGIIKNSELKAPGRIETFTGISLVDLGQLRPVPGKSAFFESVALFREHAVPAVLLEKADYWDFGTLERYWETTFRILREYRQNSNHPFLRFLVRERALKTWKIDLQRIAYHAKDPEVVNLTGVDLAAGLSPLIALGQAKPTASPGPRIWWNELSTELRPASTP
jgi:mannose-1-phosphate guanylyltransferase